MLKLLPLTFFCTQITYRIVSCYRRPTYDQEAIVYVKAMVDCLKFLSKIGVTVLVVGDFNLPGINWDLDVADPESLSVDNIFF